MNSNLAYKDAFREELIGGRFVMMSPAATNHNRVSSRIYHIFETYLDGKKCEPFADGETVFLTDEDRFVPDCMVVCDADKVQWNGVHGAPDLVVEVLSRSTAHNDRGRKKTVYAKCGVREYWIVDPANRTIEQYLQDNGDFTLQSVYALHTAPELEMLTEAERAAVVTEFKCSLFDDLIIRLEDVFRRVT